MHGVLSGRAGVLVSLILTLVGCSPAPMPDAGDTGGAPDGGTDGNSGVDARPQDAAMDAPVGPSCGASLGPCDPITNAGCMTGQACRFTLMNGRLVSSCSRAGTGGFDASCRSDDDCMETFACVSGKCHKLCCGPGMDEQCRTGPGGRPGATCTYQLGVNDMAIPIYACAAPMRCNWFSQDCMGNNTCIAIREDGTTQCVPAGTTPEGQPCETHSQCVRGHICISTGTGSATCRRICDPTGMSSDAGEFRTCPMGYSCAGLRNAPTDYGACLPTMM